MIGISAVWLLMSCLIDACISVRRGLSLGLWGLMETAWLAASAAYTLFDSFIVWTKKGCPLWFFLVAEGGVPMRRLHR
jgi:hypothetical protein